jgi:hypothetical protein
MGDCVFNFGKASIPAHTGRLWLEVTPQPQPRLFPVRPVRLQPVRGTENGGF